MERVAQQQSNAGSNGGNVMPAEAQNNDDQVAAQPTGASASVADHSHASAGGREVSISDENQQPRRTVVAAGDNPNDLVINLSQDEVTWLRERGVGADVVRKGMNIFHEHFAGIKEIPRQMLKVFAQDELVKAKNWSEEMQSSMHKDLTRAIPDMSAVFGKDPWPEPVGFSAKQVRNLYVVILEAFLTDCAKNDVVEAKAAPWPDIPEEEKTPVPGAIKITPPPKKARDKGGPKSAKKKDAGLEEKQVEDKNERDPSENDSDDSDDSSDSSSTSTSSSESESDIDDDDSNSSKKDRRRRRRKARRKRKRKRKAKRKRKRKRRAKRKKRASFSKRIKAVQASLKVGQPEYSKEHLFTCQEVVSAYRNWANPRNRREQKATVPVVVRKFVDRYLADPDAKVMDAYDLPHVKASSDERKHVTFLLNKMGKLASKVATARLERAQMALDKHNRLIEGAKLSTEARQESIKRECEWAGSIRWYSEVVSEGENCFYAAKSKLEESKRLDNFRFAHPDVPVAEAKKIVSQMTDSSLKGSSDKNKGSSDNSATAKKLLQQAKEINSLKSRLGHLLKKTPNGGGQSSGGDNKGSHSGGPNKKNKNFACWHCGSKKHSVSACPVAMAGKPPVKGSFFFKSRNKDKNE